MISRLRNISLRLSLVLNLLLLTAFLGLCAAMVWREWMLAGEIDGRPKGAVISLPRDTRIISSQGPDILLPAGTVLQESTPQGAATLGKFYGREYFLIIGAGDFRFTTNSTYQTNSGWIKPYIFANSP